MALSSFPKSVISPFLEDDAYRKLIDGAELWFRTRWNAPVPCTWRHQELIGSQTN